MRSRNCIAIMIAIVVSVVAAPAAGAAIDGNKLERLAIAQSQQLFKYYQGKPQSASPSSCFQAQAKEGFFLLPTASFWGGDRNFGCKVNTREVLVDLGGYVPTEDHRYETSTYTLTNGEVLTFAKENLERICDDLLGNLSPATAELDGRQITATPVSTSTFSNRINRTANDDELPFYQDSVDVGHPGRLTSCFTGFKAIVPVSHGLHVLRVDLTALFGSSTVMTYYLLVTRH